MTDTTTVNAHTIADKITYASTALLPQKQFDQYLHVLESILAPQVHYIDPVHELQGRDAVLTMLAKYAPRVANQSYSFDLLAESDTLLIWRWKISLNIRFSRKPFIIHGLVHAAVKDNQIVYQREYYDPIESLDQVPLVGKAYRHLLRIA